MEGMNGLCGGQRQRVTVSRGEPTCGPPCTSGRTHSGQLRRRCKATAVAHSMKDPARSSSASAGGARDKVRASSYSRTLSGTVWKRARHASVLRQTCESLFASSAPVSVEVIEQTALQEGDQREKAGDELKRLGHGAAP